MLRCRVDGRANGWWASKQGTKTRCFRWIFDASIRSAVVRLSAAVFHHVAAIARPANISSVITHLVSWIFFVTIKIMFLLLAISLFSALGCASLMFTDLSRNYCWRRDARWEKGRENGEEREGELDKKGSRKQMEGKAKSRLRFGVIYSTSFCVTFDSCPTAPRETSTLLKRPIVQLESNLHLNVLL